MKSVYFIVCLLVCSVTSYGKATYLPPSDSFPVPLGLRHLLFYVQRTPNTNTVIYELNVNEKNEINKKSPVNISWIRFTENKQRANLSFLQREYAYGLKTKIVGKDSIELRFVSYKKMPFYLVRSGSDYHVYTTLGKKHVLLQRIFLQIEGGTFWFPNVVYVEFKGKNPKTGEVIVERFKP
jgi:hypothetical protein